MVKVDEKGWLMDGANYSHQELGGLTNLNSIVQMAWRKETFDGNRRFTPDPSVPGTLRRIVDPTISGRQVDPPIDKTALQTAGGLLDWRERAGYVIVPTVYSSKWARRLLMPEELGSALDIPSDMISEGLRSGKLKGWVSEIRLPFKIRLRAALEGLSKLIGKDEPQWEKKNRLREEIDQTTIAPNKRARLNKMTEVEPIQGEAEATATHGAKSTDECPGPHVRTKDWYQEVKIEDVKEAKATKSDDAEIPKELWNDRILDALLPSGKVVSPEHLARIHKTLDWLRNHLLRYWRKKVAREFYAWWRGHKIEQRLQGLPPNMDFLRAGTEALRYAAGATWWNWDMGSAPFFWRWPPEFREDLAIGFRPMFKEVPERSKSKVRLSADQDMISKMREKIQKVITQKYVDVSEEEILAFIQYFGVKKGADNIRMVYDGTKSGLNDCLFAPWFALPTMSSMFRGLDEDYWCADNDFLVDNFLNYWISKELRAYCGVDIELLMKNDTTHRPGTYTWTQCAMGLKPSSYFAVQQNTRAQRVMLGDRHDPMNVRTDGSIAADIVSYVDDNRVSADSRESAWLASSKVAKTASWLGLQDAARKRRPPSQRPGAWA
eukprot:scaffold90616_cov31-Attheya_sp.AAC.2